jgi:hypothetical protein
MRKKKFPAVEPVMAAPKPDDRDHEAESHLRTLMDAEMIKDNPDKMKRVKAIAGRHHKAIKSIRSVQDLKDEYDNKFGSRSTKRMMDDEDME